MNAIQEFRERHGLSQRALADMVGRSQGAIGHWELGRWRPDAESCIRLEVASRGEILAADLRPDLFPRGAKVWQDDEAAA